MRRLLVFAVVAGCVTPSIPIPPPDPARMSFHLTAGQATFSYAADDRYVNSTVYVFNTVRGLGVIQSANPDGSLGPTQPFPAMEGDQVIVSIQRTDQTESVCVRVREGAPDLFNGC